MVSKKQTVQDSIRTISLKLSDVYSDKELCTHYAWWILEAITQRSKTALLIEEYTPLTHAQQEKIEQWIHKLVHEKIPLAYLIGTVPFAHCSFLVEPPILIPRHETEEWCIELIQKLQSISQPIRILDIGTGTGCIAISLAKALPHAQVVASDISEIALDLAKKNARRNEVKNISFVLSDLFETIPPTMRFDIIISNPPYISLSEWHNLDPSVKDWEDTRALIAPDNGIAILKKIINTAATFLEPHTELAHNNIPNLVIEIGYNQGNEVKALFLKDGFESVTIKKDAYGNDRLVQGYIDVATQKKI